MSEVDRVRRKKAVVEEELRRAVRQENEARWQALQRLGRERARKERGQ